MNDMLMPLKRYFDFRGRSRRREFWRWIAIVVIASVVLSILDTVLGLGGSGSFGRQAPLAGQPGFYYGARTNGGLLTGLFGLAVTIPNIAVAVRRLHDTNRSGWWILLPLLPFILGLGLGFSRLFGVAGGVALTGIFMLITAIAALVVLVFYSLDGTRGPNRFGPDPKGSGETLDEVFR